MSYQSSDHATLLPSSSSSSSFAPSSASSSAPWRRVWALLCIAAIVGVLCMSLSSSSSVVASHDTTQSAADVAAAHSVVLVEKEPVKDDKPKEKEKPKQEDEPEAEQTPDSATDESVGTALCSSPFYSAKTLKTVSDAPMVSLFRDLKGNKKFESSDVILVDNDYYVVYDNLYSIGKIDMNLPFYSASHSLLSHARSGDSGFESIVYDDEHKRFLIVVESVQEPDDPFHPAAVTSIRRAKTKPPQYHAFVEEVVVDDKTNTYELKRRCNCEFVFNSENKGFEGAVHVVADGEFFLLGLCEGNHCEGGRKGRDAGNGRLVIMKQVLSNSSDGDTCSWSTLNVLALPPTANFVDYSAIAIRTAGKRLFQLAVTSQESSQVWLGELKTGKAADASDWQITDGDVFNFPRDNQCEIQYCNIEGISFVDENMLVAVSDKMKGKGKQNFRCLQKDQSIHTFILP